MKYKWGMDSSHEVQMGQFETQNMDDLLQEREWERNWIDGLGGEDFCKDYLNLPSPPSPRLPPHRGRRIPQTSAPLGPPLPSQSIGRGQNSHGKKTRARWTNEDLKQAMGALDSGYNMREVCEAYSIPRTSLRDHYNGRVTCRKKGPQSIFTKEEENKLVEYMVEMERLAHPLSAIDLQLKVAEICQMRATPFKDGIPGRSWLKLFQKRHSCLVIRTLKSLEANRARNLSPSIINTFYANLQHLYNQENYQPSHIWNVDESEANA